MSIKDIKDLAYILIMIYHGYRMYERDERLIKMIEKMDQRNIDYLKHIENITKVEVKDTHYYEYVTYAVIGEIIILVGSYTIYNIYNKISNSETIGLIGDADKFIGHTRRKINGLFIDDKKDHINKIAIVSKDKDITDCDIDLSNVEPLNNRKIQIDFIIKDVDIKNTNNNISGLSDSQLDELDFFD